MKGGKEQIVEFCVANNFTSDINDSSVDGCAA